MTEELALDERRRQRGAVDPDERALLARAQVVDRPGDELLADAGLAQEQDRARSRRDLLRAGEDVVQGVALADDPLRPLLEPEVLLEIDVLGLEAVAELADLGEGGAQLLLGPLALGDVAGGDARAEEVARRAEDRRAKLLDPAQLSGSGADLELQPLRPAVGRI